MPADICLGWIEQLLRKVEALEHRALSCSHDKVLALLPKCMFRRSMRWIFTFGWTVERPELRCYSLFCVSLFALCTRLKQLHEAAGKVLQVGAFSTCADPPLLSVWAALCAFQLTIKVKLFHAWLFIISINSQHGKILSHIINQKRLGTSHMPHCAPSNQTYKGLTYLQSEARAIAGVCLRPKRVASHFPNAIKRLVDFLPKLR